MWGVRLKGIYFSFPHLCKSLFGIYDSFPWSHVSTFGIFMALAHQHLGFAGNIPCRGGEGLSSFNVWMWSWSFGGVFLWGNCEGGWSGLVAGLYVWTCSVQNFFWKIHTRAKRFQCPPFCCWQKNGVNKNITFIFVVVMNLYKFHLPSQGTALLALWSSVWMFKSWNWEIHPNFKCRQKDLFIVKRSSQFLVVNMNF